MLYQLSYLGISFLCECCNILPETPSLVKLNEKTGIHGHIPLTFCPGGAKMKVGRYLSPFNDWIFDSLIPSSIFDIEDRIDFC
jgi:hypothetical protein